MLYTPFFSDQFKTRAETGRPAVSPDVNMQADQKLPKADASYLFYSDLFALGTVAMRFELFRRNSSEKRTD